MIPSRNVCKNSIRIRLWFVCSDVEAKYPNLDEVEKGLSKGFRKLKKEVPDTKVPFIYSQVSAFNESIILVDSLLGISLDKYMGKIILFISVSITIISVARCVRNGLCRIVLLLSFEPLRYELS